MAKSKDKVLVHRFRVTVASDPRDSNTSSIEAALKAVPGVESVEHTGSTMKIKQ